MKKYLKWLAVIIPAVAFLVLLVNIIILNMVPRKYVACGAVVFLVVMIMIVALVSRKKMGMRIFGYVVSVVVTLALMVAGVFLVMANMTIDDFMNVVFEASEETGDADVANESFILLVNGLDAMGEGDIDKAANSDVNQLVVVNPGTHKILIVNTPRDYYVYLHGVTEMRDKLTHAGYYGAEMSRLTLEDLYEINIDYYVRINFETVTKLVDAIGGVDIESEFGFKTSSGTYVKKGWNHMNGKQALAFARERKSFGTGDIQRASDQQIVMMAIFNKISHSGALLENFSGIIESLKDCLRTDLPIEGLKEMIRMQLDEMPEWEIETMAVNGEAIYTTEVYSLDKSIEYYVVVPNEASVLGAKERMMEVMRGE